MKMETIKAGHTFAFLQFQGVINDKGTFINKVYERHRRKKKELGLLADLICLDSFEGPSGKYLVSACPVCISASSMI